MSIAGGVHRAVLRAADYGMTALQIFTRSSRSWRSPSLADEEVERFRIHLGESPLRAVVAHAGYLSNPASPDRSLRRRSERALVEELTRCERLEVPWLVLHPGSHVGSGAGGGIRRAGSLLRRVLTSTRGFDAGLLLENTAGQGDTLGSSFSEIGEILSRAGDGSRLGVCLDTCHAFAAGYDLSSAAGHAAMLGELRKEVGLRRVRALHLNDSKGPCGGRLDRHEGIGLGRIGREGFRRVVCDPALRDRPLILETPKGMHEGEDLDRRNLGILRELF